MNKIYISSREADNSYFSRVRKRELFSIYYIFSVKQNSSKL